MGQGAASCCPTDKEVKTRRLELPGCSYVYEPLPGMRRAAYSVGHVMNDLCAATWFSYLLPYLQKAVYLEKSQAGIVMFSGQIADAIATPLVGIFSDKSKGCPQYGCGRRLLWNFLGVCLVTICYLMVFGFCIPCWVDGGKSITADQSWFLRDKTINYAIAAALFNFGWASVQVSHMALVPELSIDEAERVFLNSARYGFTIFSNVTVFVTLYLLLLAKGESTSTCEHSQQADTYHTLAYIVVAIGGACSLFFLVGTKEHTPEQLKEMSKFSRKLMKIQAAKKAYDMQDVEQFEPSKEELDRIGKARQPVHGVHQDKGSFTEAIQEFGRATADCRSGSMDVYAGRYPRCGSVEEFAEEAECRSKSAHSPNGDKKLLDVLKEEDDSPIFGAGDADKKSSNASDMSNHQPRKWYDWFKVSGFYAVGLNYMCTRLVVNVSQVYIQFYIQNTLTMANNATAIVPLVVYLSSFIGTLLVKAMNKRFGRRLSYAIGGGMVTVACIIMFFLHHSSRDGTYGAAILLGLGNATIMVTTVSLEADFVGSDTESGAFVYGAMSFTDKLSNGIVILAVQFTDHDSGQFYRYIVTIIPVVAAVVGILSTLVIDIPTASTEEGEGIVIDEVLQNNNIDGRSSRRAPTEDEKGIDQPLLLNGKEY
eukprot:gb/GECG01014104.1/.p1 GENE.gb/GECG01014104.1/~~gb/GECG01014104.1/.p1  ORF type:complete len:651 (+),score=65.40 gb/GECG01014104.1/:1-1953(+)